MITYDWNEKVAQMFIDQEDDKLLKKDTNMKARITLRDRDSIEECVRHAVYTKYPPYLPEHHDERTDLRALIEDKMKYFFAYREYVTIELDLETGKASVVTLED